MAVASKRAPQVARRKRGVLHVFPRGNQWWAQVPKVGRRALDVPLEGVSKDDAYRIAAQKFGAGDLDPKAALAAREADLAELARLYTAENRHRWSQRQADNVAYRLGSFVAHVGVARIDQVTAATLSTYVEARRRAWAEEHKGARLTDAAVNRTIQIVRAMARWAVKREPPLCDPGALHAWKNLAEIARNRDPLIPSPAEWMTVVRELEREPSPRPNARAVARTRANARGLACFVALAVQTGLRFDELRHLRAADVGADVVRVQAYDGWTPKDREERDVPVPASVAELAREMILWRDQAVGLNSKRLVLGDHWVLDRVADAWARAELPGDPPGMHDCRRTFATEMSRTAGVSIRDVQRLLGHADLKTTERYLGRYRTDAARPALDLGFAAMLHRPTATVIPMRSPG